VIGPAAAAPTAARTSAQARVPSGDGRLVSACLAGDEQAWAALVRKYKNLVYAIPLRYGASPEDASDVFQQVCVELFQELPRLRNTQCLRGWLITVAAHQSFHWKRRHARRQGHEVEGLDSEQFATLPVDVAAELERDQLVREAVMRLPERCQELVRLLFFEQPPLPYTEVARRLGLATGSIGFIRGRCLRRLHKALAELGF
jgi:RNA polymerase sigma factor (sigma-70 family)